MGLPCKCVVFVKSAFHFCRLDTASGRIVEGEMESHGHVHAPAGLAYLDGVERRIHLVVHRADQFLGFNIRGGSEYGLCIYVSK